MANKMVQHHLRVIRIKQLPPVLQKGIFLCYAHLLLIMFNSHFQMQLSNTV